MARTILEIAREAAERDATAPAPATLVSTNNRIAKILRTAAIDTLREYTTRTNWIGSSELHSTWVFSTVPGRFAYPLPPDFLRMIPDTETLGGSPMGLIGPATPQSWAHWLFGNNAGRTTTAWRIRNNAFWFNDVPSTYELVTIDYVSRFPVVSLLREGDYDMSKSPPVCNAPFVPRDGYLVIAEQLDITEEGTAFFENPPGWEVGIFGEEQFEALRRLSPTSALEPRPQVRRPTFTSDTDTPVMEDDHLLSLGMTFRLRRALGLDYAEIAAEYEELLEIKASDDAGGSRSFRLGSTDCPDVAPLGGGRWLVS